MTYDEANALVATKKYNPMILVPNEKFTYGYWLGRTEQSESDYCVELWKMYSPGRLRHHCGEFFGSYPMIRPVVVVSKSKVTLVSYNEFENCATCNNSGKIEGYKCIECEEISDSIETIGNFGCKYTACGHSFDEHQNGIPTSGLYDCEDCNIVYVAPQQY